MSFDWAEYFDLSRYLAGTNSAPPSDEAKLRSAISRAYYATFCKARNLLRDKLPDKTFPQGENVHWYVQKEFERRHDRVSKDIGDHLRNLKRYREQADYEDNFPQLLETTKKALYRAGSALRQLDNLKNLKP